MERSPEAKRQKISQVADASASTPATLPRPPSIPHVATSVTDTNMTASSLPGATATTAPVPVPNPPPQAPPVPQAKQPINAMNPAERIKHVVAVLTNLRKEINELSQKLLAAQTENDVTRVNELTQQRQQKQLMSSKANAAMHALMQQHPMVFAAQFNQVRQRNLQQGEAERSAIAAGGTVNQPSTSGQGPVPQAPGPNLQLMAQMQRASGANGFVAGSGGPLSGTIPQPMQSQLHKLMQQTSGHQPIGSPLGATLLPPPLVPTTTTTHIPPNPAAWSGRMTWSGQDQAQNPRDNVLEAAVTPRSGGDM